MSSVASSLDKFGLQKAGNGFGSVSGSPLLWKELRQVMPLAVLVLLCGGAVMLLALLVAAFNGRLNAQNWSGSYFALVSLPIFFATGVGVLLVGSEKESRTLQWLQSLPISSRQIAWNKTLAMLLSIALVAVVAFLLWMLAGICHGVWPLSHPSAQVDRDFSLATTYGLVTFFLAFAGYAFAWRFQSPLVALAMIVPASSLVWLTAYGISWINSSNGYTLPDLESRIYLGTLMLTTLFLMVDSWRQSQRHLVAHSSSEHWFAGWTSSFPWTQDASASLLQERGASWLERDRVTPVTGMLWQAIQQYRWWWTVVGLFGCVAIGVSSRIPFYPLVEGSPSPLSRYDSGFAPFVLYLLGVAICWLGVFVYQGENIRDRIRFYADRGVSPLLLWVTRHWIPLLILVGLTVVRYLLRGTTGLPSESLLPAVRMMDAGRFLAIGLAIYSVGQWVSQCVNSPVVATVLATVVSNAMIFYYAFALLAMESPWWLLPVPPILFFIATAWLMQPWMERRHDWRFKLKHGMIAVTALAIPLVPGILKMLTIPRSSAEVRRELTALTGSQTVEGLRGNGFTKEVRFYNQAASLASVPDDFAANDANRRKVRVELVQRGWDSATVRQWLGRGGIRICITEMLSLRKQLEAEETRHGEQIADLQSQYRSMLSHFPRLIRELRGTGYLRLCDQAEHLELALLNECRLAEARHRIGDALFWQLADVLAESDQRDHARKVALAQAWWDLKESRRVGNKVRVTSPGGYNPIQFGAYGSVASGGLASMIGNLRLLRAPERWAQDLWHLLKQITREDRHRARAEYADKMGFQMTPPDLYTDLIWLGGDAYGVAPCQLWRGDWEESAKALNGTPSRSMQSETEVESGS
jgi:ABC-type transport system involved in multi-copper enzyme maturation permease subunit